MLLRSVERVSITARRNRGGLGWHSHCDTLWVYGSRWSRMTAVFRNVVQRCDEVASPSVEPIRGFGAPIVAHPDCRDSTP